ncbi:MAG: nucleoside phosphorylase [Chloroflexota bacterium]|nr:nucleoside phosphorylase [Chloroflexota bacterium]
MSWPFDTSEAYITPEHDVERQRARRGLSPEEWRLPSTLVATFQMDAYERMLERAGRSSERGNRTYVAGLLDSTRGAADDNPVVVARFSIGAPATAAALEQMIARGVRDAIVVGAAGSLQPHLPLGALVLVEGAEREDGTSHHYLPAGEVVSADPELTAQLEECARTRGVDVVRGRSWTIDAVYRETVGAIRRHRDAEVAVVEMEAAATFAVARVRGVRAALLVAVSDELFGHTWNPAFGEAVYAGALQQAADIAMDASVRVAAAQRPD